MANLRLGRELVLVSEHGKTTARCTDPVLVSTPIGARLVVLTEHPPQYGVECCQLADVATGWPFGSAWTVKCLGLEHFAVAAVIGTRVRCYSVDDWRLWMEKAEKLAERHGITGFGLVGTAGETGRAPAARSAPHQADREQLAPAWSGDPPSRYVTDDAAPAPEQLDLFRGLFA